MLAGSGSPNTNNRPGSQLGTETDFVRVRPQRYMCPHCKWDFAYRKKRRCPGCGTLLLIASDMLSDSEFTALRSFWIWGARKQKWEFVRDWEEHKREAARKFEEYANRRSRRIEAGESPEIPKPWIH